MPDATPAPSGFDDLGLPRKVVAALVLEDIDTPTPVQAAVIPDALAGYDVLGRAQTGSGKTLAFGLPIVARLAGEKSRIHRPRALVIVPTRELALQVERSLESVARAVRLRLTTVYGGTRYDKQIAALRRATDIVVATPGRLQDLIDKRVLDTSDVQITVLDEADHLCDLGFFPAVDQLLSLTPEGGQRMLLSATLDGDVDRLVRKHLRNPRLHELDPSAGAVTTMEHHVLVVGGFRDKTAAAVRLVEANPRSIVFTRTREGATELRNALAERGIGAVDLHGNLSQHVRERNLERFADGRAQAIVATDVAARGIHVDGVAVVVHFDPPTDPKAYLHRSGRTARAGESGAVVTLVTPRQVGAVVSMQKAAGVRVRHHDLTTAPERLTREALAASGTDGPARGHREHRPGASRPPHRGGPRRQGGPGGQPSQRGAAPREDRPASRSGEERSATGRSARESSSEKRGSGRPAGQGSDGRQTSRSEAPAQASGKASRKAAGKPAGKAAPKGGAKGASAGAPKAGPKGAGTGGPKRATGAPAGAKKPRWTKGDRKP